MKSILAKYKDEIAGTEEKRRLLGNVFSLGMLQGANYIVPLLTVPYLVRVLGPEYFGLLAFATAVVTYFVLLTDYGFNLSATRQISLHRDNGAKLNEIYSAVITIKFMLAVVSLLVMSVLVFTVDRFSQNWALYYASFMVLIGQVMFPTWFFQGMERMKFITILNVGAKIFFTLFIFLLVKDESDYLLVPFLTGLGFIVAGVYSMYLVKTQFSVVYRWQSFSVLKFQLVEGWYVFVSGLAISLYTTTVIFILGVFASNATVGYFSAAEKIIKAVRGLYVPIAQAIYPLISKKIHTDRQVGIKFIKKAVLIVGMGMLFVCGVLYIFAEPIVIILLGAQFEESILYLKIMAFLPFIVALGNMFGIQTMLNLGYKKEFTFFVFLAAISGLVLSFALTIHFHALGASIATLIVEILITTMLGLFVYSKIRNNTL